MYEILYDLFGAILLSDYDQPGRKTWESFLLEQYQTLTLFSKIRRLNNFSTE